MHEFTLIENISLPEPDKMVKVVKPNKPITYGEVKKIDNNHDTILIDGLKYEVLAVASDLIPRMDADPWKHLGKDLIEFRVKKVKEDL